jgi:putative FmdB family regulatory protein
MPIYEFYCADCNTVFSFFSATVAPGARPACPRCGRPELPRRPSRFAARSGGRAAADEGEEPDALAGLDDDRLEKAFEAMAAEFESLDHNAEPDPRQLSRVLRRFTELTGLEAGPKLHDLLARLERGEDPEALESSMGAEGEAGGEDDLAEFFELRRKLLGRDPARPRVDETLYFL